MKKILFIAILMFSVGAFAQVQGFDMVNFNVKSEAEMNAIDASDGLQKGSVLYREDTDSLWRYNGSVWAEISGSGGATTDASDLTSGVLADARVQESNVTQHEAALSITESQISDFGTYLESGDIDTFNELNTIVADKTLLKAEDAQTITGFKTFVGSIQIDSSAAGIAGAIRMNAPALTQNGLYGQNNEGVMYFNTGAMVDFSYQDEVAPNTGTLSLDFSAIDGREVFEFPATGGTIALTSDLGGGSSLPVSDATSLVEDPVDGTKEMRIDVGAVSTSTVRVLTMPDSDVNLGNLVVGPASATDNALVRFDGSTGKLVQSSSVGLNDTNGMSGLSSITLSGTTNWINFTAVDATPTPVKGIIYFDDSESTLKQYNGSAWEALNTGGTDDQVLSLGGTGNKDLTIEDGNTVDLTGVDGIDPDNIVSDGTGRTNADQITNFIGQTQADYDTDGAPSAGTYVYITDASPARVIATATVAMDGWKMYDDQTADAATITLSDCDPGETLTVYINRASAPTLAGTGLTFNQLPNTTAFASATQMMIIFEVAYDGTTIDYYYVER